MIKSLRTNKAFVNLFKICKIHKKYSYQVLNLALFFHTAVFYILKDKKQLNESSYLFINE